STFANNVGADDALFFSGALGGPVGGPTFTIAGSPFLYDPSGGNLLMDIFVTPGGSSFGGGYFDALEENDSFAGETSRMQTFGGGTTRWGLGLVTQFSAVAAVPEPSSLALFGLGSLVLARRRRRPRAA